MRRLYLSPPELGGSELQLLADAVESGWMAPLGPHVDSFEAELAARVEMPHALALSSGTAALHLALRVLDVGPGQEVWCSTLTFAATAFAVTYVGAIPVFIDSDRESWNMDPQLFADALDHAAGKGQLPKAVIIVDLYGQCADMDPIVAACRKHAVPMIEDAAEALGATYKGRPAGSFGDLGVFSFNGNKIITTSGGGMLVGRSKELIDRARYLSTQARVPAPHYEHTEVGYNYRLSNLLAAVGRAQLLDLDRRILARRHTYSCYREALGGLVGWSFMPWAEFGEPTAWLTCATLDTGRDAVLDALARENIEARPVWKPMHMQPVFAQARVVGGSVAAELFEHGICLPSGSSLTASERDRVIEIVRGLFHASR